jgi:Clp amino terminal domain, pathogenicity island component
VIIATAARAGFPGWPCRPVVGPSPTVGPAQEEARTLNRNDIGTEHIMLGLVRVGEGPATQVLAGLGLTRTGSGSK